MGPCRKDAQGKIKCRKSAFIYFVRIRFRHDDQRCAHNFKKKMITQLYKCTDGQEGEKREGKKKEGNSKWGGWTKDVLRIPFIDCMRVTKSIGSRWPMPHYAFLV